MNTVRSLVYHGLAAIAMLAHVILVGLASLVTLWLTSPAGTEIPLLILKGVVLVSWLGFGWLGLLGLDQAQLARGRGADRVVRDPLGGRLDRGELDPLVPQLGLLKRPDRPSAFDQYRA